MKDNPRTRLNWFLSFINLDIPNLTNVKLLTLWEEIRTLVFGELGPIAVLDSEIIKWNERKKQTKEIQAALKKLLEEILAIHDKRERKMKTAPFVISPEVAQELGLGGIATEVQLIMSYDLQKEPLPKTIRKRIPIVSQSDLNIIVGEKIFPFSPDIEKTLLRGFASALSSFRLALIQRCQRKDCGGYFLKGTKKEKRYCSKRCYFTEAQRERRRKGK